MKSIGKRQPLYHQLLDSLRELIQTELTAGDALPAERVLAERYHVSRTTVRLALQELDSLGLIRREHGRGTFVNDHAMVRTNLMSSYSFTTQMRELGRTPLTVILEFNEQFASTLIAERLGIEPDATIFYIKRLRLADSIPMMVEYTYLPADRFKNLTLGMLQTTPLYEIIEQKFCYKIKAAEEEFYASLASRADAELLDILEGAPILQLTRTTTTTHHVIVEYTQSSARADQFKYKVIHTSNSAHEY